jgi:hypothetical protein
MASRILTRPAIRRGSILEYFGRNNLKGCWSLNGHARDESGNENHGTVVNAIPYPARFNLGYRFDGSGDYIDVPDNFSSLSSGSIGGWIYIYSFATNLDFIMSSYSQAAVPESNYLAFQVMSTACMQFALTGSQKTGGILGTTTPTNLKASNWYHVVYTSGASGNAIYINGVKQNLTYTVGNSTTQAFFSSISSLQETYIGRLLYGGVYYARFNGIMNDVFIFSRALSPAEISQYYQWATAAPRKFWFYSPEIVIAGGLLVHPSIDDGYNRRISGGYN